MQISVEISELKRMNVIAELPVIDQNSEIAVPQKVDNDLESSDLGFSEGREIVDEHDEVVDLQALARERNRVRHGEEET